MESARQVLKRNIVKSRRPLLWRASLVLGLWNKVVEEVYKEVGRGKSQAISFRDGSLKVAVYYQIWLLELRLREEQLISLLNQKLNSSIVKSIKTVLLEHGT